MSSNRSDVRAENPQTWIAVDEGDTITGEVTNIVAAWSDAQNGYYPLLTVRVIDSQGGDYATDAILSLHAYATALHNEIVAQRVLPGETIRVEYFGTGEARVRGQSGAERYRLTIPNRPPEKVAEIAYSQLRRRGERPQPPAELVQPVAVAPDVPVDDEPLPF
jgi:hypothetical protein